MTSWQEMTIAHNAGGGRGIVAAMHDEAMRLAHAPNGGVGSDAGLVSRLHNVRDRDTGEVVGQVFEDERAWTEWHPK